MANIINTLIGDNFAQIVSLTRAKKSCSAFGVQNSLKPPIASMCSDNILYIVSDYIIASKVKENFEALGKNVNIFVPNTDCFLYKKAQTNTNNIMRIKTLFDIFSRKQNVIIATADSLFSPCADPEVFASCIMHLKVGQTISPRVLARQFADCGYTKSDFASEAGLFSVRGEIVDIFAINYDYAVRIDYFDDQIESINILDENGKAKEKLSSISICPNSNLLLSSEEEQEILQKLENMKNRQFDDANEQVIFQSQVEDLYNKLSSGDRSFNQDCVFSLACKPYTLMDYLVASGRDYVYFIDESKFIYDVMAGADKENCTRLKELYNSKTLIADKNNALNSFYDVLEKLRSLPGVVFQRITNANKFFNPDAVIDFDSKPVSKYLRDSAGLAKDIEIWQQNGFKIYLLAPKNQAEQLYKNLESYDVDISLNKGSYLDKSGIYPITYPNGWILPHERLVYIGTYDLFAKPSKKLSSSREDVFSVPKVGDYVVHAVHGIGVCEGVTQLSGNFGTKDYVVVRYRDGDKLYVPTTQMNLLDRFSGGDVPKKLSKIGGQEFEKVKQKVKENVKKLAFDLVKFYAQRESLKGYAFSQDNMVQKEFENSFAYTETQDQLTSIAEIKKDMQSHKVMDRLLCGDVGFGKTEVAMRSAFKAVLDNKQVAFLAPTTILCQQHYNTCLKRMQEFGVNVEVLNRFKSAKEVKDILQRLKEHKIDILCSTHRALSDDVVFADLGLVVLDEEQKFGVNDKEKLKTKHPNVDVLTLSATPIPRTLHMSLSGIRDISVISTPPSQRLPVNTYVTEFSESLVRDAIMREKNRGGQTFILFNRVEKIYDFATKIRQIVPECTILVGHGQLAPNLLEQVVYDFYNGKADVLICTTIMENGIDIENANTLIVCDADRFGLSQLYQIRGRVGRGNKMAYAYFTYEYNKTLTQEAYKRLEAISEFTEFGSGFKLAMRDLEIRGSGNVLGAEQHGFLQKVGYDMYAKLLSQAVAEARGEKVEEKVETQMKININAFVPESYISSSEQRMIAYKKIASISSKQDVNDIIAEFENTLGKLPASVLNLIDIAYLKNLASKLKIVEILCSNSQAYLMFEKRSDIMESEILGNTIYKFSNCCSLDLGENPKIKFISTGDSASNYLLIKQFIEFATK